MKAALLIAAMVAGGPATADDREVPIGNICAGLHYHVLVETSDVGDGWIRAVISRSMSPDGTVRMATMVWDVRCADGMLAEVGRSLDEAAAVEPGQGPWPGVACAPDDKFPAWPR